MFLFLINLDSYISDVVIGAISDECIFFMDCEKHTVVYL